MMNPIKFNKLKNDLLEVFDGMDKLSAKWGQERYSTYRAKVNFLAMYLDDMKYDFTLSNKQHETLKDFTYKQHKGEFKNGN